MERIFGRNVSPPDYRDFNLKEFIPRGALGTLAQEKAWDFPQESLDQGSTPHCVGFAMANFGINLPVFTPYTNEAGHKFYYKCKKIDGDPKGEDGTTIRSAAKALREQGIITAYAFAYDINMIKWWLLNKGPLIVGTLWTEGMMVPDSNNMIHPTGMKLGGHGYVINEWDKWELGERIGIQNSWGESWGINGKAYISVEDFTKLFMYDGEAMTAVELENHVKKPCWLVTALRNAILRL